ncbi:membrane protein [Croceivirga lutea]|nr:membrane protein [Croceivirga lutea]
MVHLLQLRKFKKTPFTNVAMLQKVIAESRKSNSLKKWLLLSTRLLLLAALVFAFAQPFSAKETAFSPRETVVYLDNSFSMQAKQNGISLLERAIQDFLKSVPETSTFSLFTNSESFKNIDVAQIQNQLLQTEFVPKQLSIENILLKANTLFTKNEGSIKNLILISDFQNSLGSLPKNIDNFNLNLIQLKPDSNQNLAIDSVYVESQKGNQLELAVIVKGLQEDQTVPISLYNKEKLIAKNAIKSKKEAISKAILSLPLQTAIQGKLEIKDGSLSYDNSFYFNLDDQPKIKVLSITANDANFLNRIFTEDEFDFIESKIEQLDYSNIANQNLVILNELTTIPLNLQASLNAFEKDGGSIVIIPSKSINSSSYNTLLTQLFGVNILDTYANEVSVNKISFEHPLYTNVFERKVENFEFPYVKKHYVLANSSSKILSLSNENAFLIGKNNNYLFTAWFSEENTDFKESPLIVPTFYKFGVNSLKMPTMYYTMGKENSMATVTTLEKDQIITAKNKQEEFIPFQQSYTNKTELSFIDNPTKAGIFSIVKSEDTLQHVSFNYPRNESELTYQTLSLTSATINNSVSELFSKIASENSIDAYWKWFVIFAMVFALAELLIQKFLA